MTDAPITAYRYTPPDDPPEPEPTHIILTRTDPDTGDTVTYAYPLGEPQPRTPPITALRSAPTCSTWPAQCATRGSTSTPPRPDSERTHQ